MSACCISARMREEVALESTAGRSPTPVRTSRRWPARTHRDLRRERQAPGHLEKSGKRKQTAPGGQACTTGGLMAAKTLWVTWRHREANCLTKSPGNIERAEANCSTRAEVGNYRVCALEQMIMSTTSPVYFRKDAWWICVQSWARFRLKCLLCLLTFQCESGVPSPHLFLCVTCE